jgi:hypothetical protein
MIKLVRATLPFALFVTYSVAGQNSVNAAVEKVSRWTRNLAEEVLHLERAPGKAAM